MPGLPAGTVRSVVRAPHPVLSTPGRDVDPTDAATIELAAALLATQLVSPGCVGLAAQQVGVAVRVFSVDVSGHAKTRTCHGLFVLCNAVVLSATRKERGREGCMSVPDFTGTSPEASVWLSAASSRSPGSRWRSSQMVSRPWRCSTRSTTPTVCSSWTGSADRAAYIPAVLICNLSFVPVAQRQRQAT